MEERWIVFKNIMARSNLIDVEWASSAAEAKRQLAMRHWDVVCLDHDLGGKTFVDSDENSGFEVAKVIGNDPSYNDQTVFVHSWNPDGARNMCNALMNYAYIPFSKDYCEIVFRFALDQVEIS